MKSSLVCINCIGVVIMHRSPNSRSGVSIIYLLIFVVAVWRIVAPIDPYDFQGLGPLGPGCSLSIKNAEGRGTEESIYLLISRFLSALFCAN